MLQFPAPFPADEIPAPTSFEQLGTCIFIVFMAVFLLSMLLPRKHFVALFKIAFPWMPDKLR
jgi:hypothetical protein